MPEVDNTPPRPPVAADKADKNVFTSHEQALTKVAEEVAAGMWGEGEYLRQKLREDGFDPREVRAKIIELHNNA